MALLLDRQTIQGLMDMDKMIGILKQAGIKGLGGREAHAPKTHQPI